MKERTVYVSEELDGNYVFDNEKSAKEKVGDNYFEHDAWYCEHCELNEVFITEEDRDKHEVACVMNPDNKSILTSKWLGVELYPPYPRYEKKGRDRYLVSAIGRHSKPYDVRTGDYLSDKDLYRTCKGYEPRGFDIIGQRRRPEVFRTEAYNKYIKLLDEAERDANDRKEKFKKALDRE